MKRSIKKLSTLIAGVALFTAVNAHAEFYKSKPYVGGNITDLTYSESGLSDDLSLLAGYARFGSQFDDYLSLEWRVGTGLQDDEVTVSGVTAGIDLDLFYGAYVLGGIPITEYIYPYALVGYTKAEFGLEVSGTGNTGEFEDKDISFGVGVNINFSDRVAINAEYIRYIKEDGIELAGPSLGFLYYF